MGLLAKMALKPETIDAQFTIVKIKALDTGNTSVIRILEAQYSNKGDIVKTEELPSFEGEWSVVYMSMFKFYWDLALKSENLIKAGRLK